MKTLKNKFLPLMTLILGLGIMSGSFAQRTAKAGRVDTVPAIQVNNAQKISGRYLHVVYAVGRPGFISVSQIPYLDVIRTIKSVQATAPTVSFPSVQLEKLPLRGSYNMIVFVVSNSPTINWQNPDVNPNVNYTWLKTIDKLTVDVFVNQNGAGSVLTFSL